uniref:VWFA domain-containing protein n=1 Tax=Strongyloides venezuelensis TaxID=75913 RepID=A0A0K0G5D0_STRVS
MIIGRALAIRIFQRYHFSSQLKIIIVAAGYTPPGCKPIIITAVKSAIEVLEKRQESQGKEIKKSCHSVVIITGDNPLTACHVFKELKFTEEGKEIMILRNKSDE